MLLSIILTTIVLTANNPYSTFASPIVSNSSVTTILSLNTHLLAKRAPPDQRCTTAAQWRSRACKPKIGDRAWEDRCTGPNGGVVIRFVTGLCPENTICADIASNTERNVACNARPVIENNPGPNRQTGVSQFGSIYQHNVLYMESVQLLNDISSASVSALLEGTSGYYVIAPYSPIVGNLRGTGRTSKACDYNATTLNCVPTGQYDLKKGSWIDFTFGIMSGQVVNFYYAIVGG